MADPMQVEVVSADRVVWSGKATNIIAKTVDGDIGILPGHSPVLGVLVPGAVEVLTPDGQREIVAVGGGFISVAGGRVSILSEFAELSGEIKVSDAEHNLREAEAELEGGNESAEVQQRYQRAQGQLKAAQKAG